MKPYKTFAEWMEAKARLGDVTDHPLYGHQPASPPQSPPRVPQQHQGEIPLARAVPDRKLDTSVPPQQVVDQYLRAFATRLESGVGNEEAEQMIATNAKTLAFKYGPSAGEYFTKKARFKLDNYRSFQRDFRAR